MTFETLLDELVSFFRIPYGLAQWLVWSLFPICGLVLAAIGWKRHRVFGFLLFLVSSALGTASSVIMIAVSQDPNTERTHLFSTVTALAFLSNIINLWGLGHFVFRAKFAPPTKPEIYQP